jgi:hypothetical protein
MHQRISVDDEDHKGRQSEKGEERQFDIEEGQFDWAFQQKIFMGDGARRDRDVGENEEIGEPEPAADRSRIFDRFFDLLEIVGLSGDGGYSGRRRCGRGLAFGPPCRLSEPPCAQSLLLHHAPS